MALQGFGELFGNSINDYKKHFRLFLKVSFLLYFLPTMIVGIVMLYFTYVLPLDEFLLGLLNNLTQIIDTMFTLLLTFTVIKILLIKRTKQQELTVSEAFKEGSAHFVEGFVLSIILGLALLGLFLLLIIPGIIFAVYWAFSYYALITDDVDVGKAMSHSKKVVQGRWWKVFGYSLLLGLIGVCIAIALLIPIIIVGMIIVILFQNAFMGGFIGLLGGAVIGMFLTPFSLTFMEKFYLNLKENTPDLGK